MKRCVKAAVEDQEVPQINLDFAQRVLDEAAEFEGIKRITGEYDDTYVSIDVETKRGFQPSFELLILQKDITDYMEDFGFDGLVGRTVEDIESLATDPVVNPDDAGGIFYYNFGLIEYA